MPLTFLVFDLRIVIRLEKKMLEMQENMLYRPLAQHTTIITKLHLLQHFKLCAWPLNCQGILDGQLVTYPAFLLSA